MPVDPSATQPNDESSGNWFDDLVCPISTDRVNEHVVRTTALVMAAMAIAYLVTGARWIPLLMAIDFCIRGFWRRDRSAAARLAGAIVARLGRPPVMIDFAPKLFAARVGLLFTVAITLTHGAFPTAARLLAGILIVFALLEGLGNICVGCIVYSLVVVPLVRRRG
jgi:hypothetical protein